MRFIDDGEDSKHINSELSPSTTFCAQGAVVEVVTNLFVAAYVYNA